MSVLAARASIASWVLAIRAKTLTAAVLPVLIGSALVWGQNSESAHTKWWCAPVALLCALAIQIGTNLFNDALDFSRGADREGRLGPLRVTQAGLVSPAAVLRAACYSFGFALCLGMLLVWEGGLPILIIGVASLLFGYLYTGGPFPLAYRGLGDIFVLIFFGLVAVSGTTYLLTGEFTWDALVAGMQVGCLAVTLIAINNLRDNVGDRAAGKWTAAVLLGERGARIEIWVSLLVPFVLGVWWWESARTATLFPLFLLPLAIKIGRAVQYTEPGKIYNQFLARAAALHAAFGILLSVGFIWERVWKYS